MFQKELARSRLEPVPSNSWLGLVVILTRSLRGDTQNNMTVHTETPSQMGLITMKQFTSSKGSKGPPIAGARMTHIHTVADSSAGASSD